MSTFDKREQGYEAKYIHDEEMRFKVMAHCNKMPGDWAAKQLGLNANDAADCAREPVTRGSGEPDQCRHFALGSERSREERSFGAADRETDQ